MLIHLDDSELNTFNIFTMKTLKSAYFFIMTFILLSSSVNSQKIQNKTVTIIPLPVEFQQYEGVFILNRRTIVYVDANNEELLRIAREFVHNFNVSSGYSLKIQEVPAKKAKKNRSILFTTGSGDQSLNKEGYKLSVSDDGVVIEALHPAGVFYGMQTLKQLLPVEIEINEKVNGICWCLPYVEIKDYPRFQWRGLHLDVSRHMSSVDFIKRYLDYMAMHKLNKFHWHLTDDQGWRIEIKKYPRLTEIGAWRDSTELHFRRSGIYDGTRYGGYYSQQEIKDIVAYAKTRYITVVPEIDMPGHAQSAIAAYPWLGVTGDSIPVKTNWGISEYLFNVKDETFLFLENVLLEVMELFPCEYIHIGGDEAVKKQWRESEEIQSKIRELGLKNEYELQSWFIQRIEKFVNSKGRYIIGWDEILEGGLAPNATVMSWRGEKGGIEAARDGNNVVMSPMLNLYFNIYQIEKEYSPRRFNEGLVTLEKMYRYNPIPEELAEDQEKYVLGPHGCMWTAFVTTEEMIEHMLFPRLSALSEIAWSREKDKNWEDFKTRIPGQMMRYKHLGVNYSKNVYFVTYDKELIPEQDKFKVTLKNQFEMQGMRFTLDGKEPSPASALYSEPLLIEKGATIKAGLFQDGILMGEITQLTL